MAWLENYHTHTTFSDGANTVDEMVQEAIRLGMPIIGFSDHSKNTWSLDYCLHEEDAYRKAVQASRIVAMSFCVPRSWLWVLSS